MMYPLSCCSMNVASIDVVINMPLPLIYKFRTFEMFGHVFVPKKNLYLKAVNTNKSTPKYCEVFTSDGVLLSRTEIQYNTENQKGVAFFDSILMRTGRQYFILFHSEGQEFEFGHSESTITFPVDLGLVELIGAGRENFTISYEKINIIESIIVEEAELIEPIEPSTAKRLFQIGLVVGLGYIGYRLIFKRRSK